MSDNDPGEIRSALQVAGWVLLVGFLFGAAVGVLVTLAIVH